MPYHPLGEDKLDDWDGNRFWRTSGDPPTTRCRIWRTLVEASGSPPDWEGRSHERADTTPAPREPRGGALDLQRARRAADRVLPRRAGKHSVPVLRALAFQHLCEHKTIYLGDGRADRRRARARAQGRAHLPRAHLPQRRGPADPRRATEDELRRRRRSVVAAYEDEVIPYWRGRSLRDRIFAALPDEWHEAYEAGIFTEFMEQRAPGHTVLDDKIYRKGLLDFKPEIAAPSAALDFAERPRGPGQARAAARRWTSPATRSILFAERHAELAERAGRAEDDPQRRRRARADRRRLPAGAGPRAARLPGGAAVLLVLSPGGDHRAQRLGRLQPRPPRPAPAAVLRAGPGGRHPDPRRRQGAAGVLSSSSSTTTRRRPRSASPRPRAAPTPTSPTSTSAACWPTARTARTRSPTCCSRSSTRCTCCSPANNSSCRARPPIASCEHALRVIRKGYGFPSIFNADAVVEEQLRQGKTLEDARAGGCSGCVETGAFGKEAYILTGYFNLPKMLELALHDGVDPRTGEQLGPRTGEPADLDSPSTSCSTALRTAAAPLRRDQDPRQPDHRADLRREMPAPFLSVLIDDCIANGRDYNAGGARYNNTYIQGVGHRHHHRQPVGDQGSRLRRQASWVSRSWSASWISDFAGSETAAPAAAQPHPQVRQRRRLRRRPDGAASSRPLRGRRRPAQQPRAALPHRDAADHLPRLLRLGARARRPTAGGPGSRSPRASRRCRAPTARGPTAVLKSAAKMDHVKTGGTLLNMKFTPSLVAGDDRDRASRAAGAQLLQDGRTSRPVQRGQRRDPARGPGGPDDHRDLIVRVAGYSDYFCDLSEELQDEIIARTEHDSF